MIRRRENGVGTVFAVAVKGFEEFGLVEIAIGVGIAEAV